MRGDGRSYRGVERSRDREGERAEAARQQARQEIRWSLFAIECQDAIAAGIKNGLITRPKPRPPRRWPGQTARQIWDADNKAYLNAYKKKWEAERKLQRVAENSSN